MCSAENSLQVDLVVQTLFSFLSVKELKSCRLVCTQWWKYATKALQKCGRPITFGGLYKINLFQIRHDMETIKCFQNVMETSSIIPYVKFVLRPYMFSKESKTILENFLYRFGPIIQFLTVSLAHESEDSFPESYLLPNLKLLQLKTLDFCNLLRGEKTPGLKSSLRTSRKNLLSSLLDSAVWLEDLILWSDSENIIWPGEVIDLLCSKDLHNLQNLKISFPLDNANLSKLEHLKAQLKSLTFIFRRPSFRKETFKNVLSVQRKTLQYLKIVDMQCDETKSIEFPVLEQLRTLEIEGTFYGENCLLSISHFSYRKLPNLQTLILKSLNRLNFALESILYVDSISYSVNEFHFSVSNDFIDPDCVYQISRTLPNLKTIRVVLQSKSEEILQAIFQYLPNLVEVSFDIRKIGMNFENLDDVMTGFSAETCRDILHSGDFCSLVETDIKIKPGITDLQKLSILHIDGEHGNHEPGDYAFTDVTGYHAFLKMSNLKSLSMWQSGLSEECLSQLAKKFDLIRIPTGNSD